MKYKVLKKHGGRGGVIRREGDVCDINETEAPILLRSGHIERVKQPVRKSYTKVSDKVSDDE